MISRLLVNPGSPHCALDLAWLVNDGHHGLVVDRATNSLGHHRQGSRTGHERSGSRLSRCAGEAGEPVITPPETSGRVPTLLVGPVLAIVGSCLTKVVLRTLFNPIGHGLDDNTRVQRITPLTHTQTSIDAGAEIFETSRGSAHTVLTIGHGEVGNNGHEVHPSTTDGITASKQFPGNSLRPQRQAQSRQGNV